MGKEISFHVFTTHTTDLADSSPMLFISADQLAYYRRAEVVAVLFGSAAVGALLASVILFVCSSKIMLTGG